jgi:hypothetical protein
MSSGALTLGAFAPRIPCIAAELAASESFVWNPGGLLFSFEIASGRLRQKRMVPADAIPTGADLSSGVEVALQCSGENSPDQGMKSGAGQPGTRLLFEGRREEQGPLGKRLVCTHSDSLLNLKVESVYEAFEGVRVVRRHTRVANTGNTRVGIEFLS